MKKKKKHFQDESSLDVGSLIRLTGALVKMSKLSPKQHYLLLSLSLLHQCHVLFSEILLW